MARRKPARGAEAEPAAKPAKPPAAAPAAARSPHRLAIGLLLAATLLFHGHALFTYHTSVQWDAVDVHYTQQKYFSDHIRSGALPHWTPYIFSGYPFLADPQTGAWYPLNWPFFLAGVTPFSVQAELALHTFLAALGAYLFAWRFLRRTAPSLAAAFAYSLSGFFAGHASHVGIFQAAAWLPWILLAVDRGARRPGLASKVAPGLLTGVMALAGHFQTALYCGFAVAIYSVWLLVEDRSRWQRLAATLAGTALFGAAISAMMAIPGAELFGHSVRAAADFSAATNSPLVISSLGTLIYPNLFGALSGGYTGPADITQYYFYAGLLLLPLAGFAFQHGALRWPALALVVVPAWYALGPSAGLYSVLTKLPGLSSVRAPVHIWFVAAFGLALLAASGLHAILERFPSRWLAAAIPALLFFDLYHFNSANNPLAYARSSFADLYGDRLAEFTERLGSKLPPLERFHAPYPLQAFGPQNHPLDARTETTYGYNPLMLAAYNDYFQAVNANPKLPAELGARFRINPQAGGVESSEDVMPRVTVPRRVIAVTAAQAAARLASLDPREEALWSGPPVAAQDAAGSATVAERGEGRYRIRYRVRSSSLIRVAEAYYPGWRAIAAGSELEVFPVDRALIGFVVPAGEGEVELRFQLRRFYAAAAVSLSAAILAAALLLLPYLRRRPAMEPPSAPAE